MPELPEVETIRLFLKNNIIGKKIISIDILNKKSLSADPKNIIGQKIFKLSRTGKQLSIYLDNKFLLLIHLKMTGQLIYVAKSQTILGHPTPSLYKTPLPWKSTRVIFTFSDKSKLYFNDQRKFGWIKLIKQIDLKNLQSSLGPDILSPNFSLRYFQTILKNSTCLIKTFLHDQSKLAGVGNIYANDALFLSSIHPKVRCNQITKAQSKSLYQNIKKVIRQGIKHTNPFLTYQRDGQPCLNCSTKIVRLKLQGRSAFFCPNCQKLSN